jgi:hypothetical protein
MTNSNTQTKIDNTISSQNIDDVNFDCVAFMRDIRNKLSVEIEYMTLEEEIKYLNDNILLNNNAM